MLPPRPWRLVVFIFALAFNSPPLSAMVVEGRSYRGQHVQCIHGGAWLSELDLGVNTRAQIYEQVFTGAVQSVVEVSFTDRRLTIVPDEVFLGDVTKGEVIASVNQACLPEEFPEIKAGDKWVFYLKTKKYLYPDANPPYISTDRLMVAFDSPAKPVSLAQYDICLLRLHTDIDETCTALMPVRRHQPRPSFCPPWQDSPFLFTNPFPRSSQFSEPKIKLARISPPPEFRADAVNGGHTTGASLWPRGWLFSCPDDDD
jgi:hypothetical protein